jgi:putative ABC transport system substrate-binding protein
VDLILAISPAAIRAVRSTTETIPIVAGDLESDPVDAGFIASFARPGGNITGTFLDFPEFGKKWLEILREAVPHVRSVGVFWDPATGVVQLRAIEAAAHTLKLKLETMEVHGPTDLEKSVLSAKQRGVDALLFLSSPFIGATQNYLRT